MDIAHILINLLAGASFGGILILGLILLVVSLAASGSNAGTNRVALLAALALFIFNIHWLFNGFAFMQDVFAGNVFASDYWTSAAAPQEDGAPSGWVSTLAWAGYLFVFVILFPALFYSFGGFVGTFDKKGQSMGPSPGLGRKLLAVIALIVVAWLTYLWQDQGRHWLIGLMT